MKCGNIICIRELAKPKNTACGKKSEEGILWSPRVMQYFKIFLAPRKFQFEQEVLANLKVLNLKSDLKNEV